MWDKRLHATYIVSNLCFDAEVISELAPPDAQPRRHAAGAASACPGRLSAPSCCRWPPRSASGSRRGSSAPTSARSRGSPRLAATTRRSSSRKSSGAETRRSRRRRPAPLHVQPGRGDRELAAGTAALMSSDRRAAPAARARGRGDPVSTTVSGRSRAAAASAGHRLELGIGLLGQPYDARVVGEVGVAQLRVAVEAELLEHRPRERPDQEVREQVGAGLLGEEAGDPLRTAVDVVAVQPASRRIPSRSHTASSAP